MSIWESSVDVAKDKKETEIPKELRPITKKILTAVGMAGTIGAFSTAADVATIAGSWGTLMVTYAKYYGLSLDEESATKLATTTILGLRGYYAGCKLAAKMFHLIPGLGTIAAMGISSFQNMVFTYRFATILVRLFSKKYVEWDSLALSIKNMFAKEVFGILSIGRMVNLYLEN